jgi:hypothetical protein
MLGLPGAVVILQGIHLKPSERWPRPFNRERIVFLNKWYWDN